MSQTKEDNANYYSQLQQLKQEVRLTSSKLLDLTYHESQFLQKIEDFNLKARNLITEDFIEQALIYLAEAERLLQYGASCGKTIDRNLIICTLHNEACCYYKAPDLVTASKYLEAVIFNLKTHLQSVQSTPNQSSSSQRRGRKGEEFLPVAVQKKIELVHYHLKYCTINSQAKNRILALDAGKRVIQLLKSLFTDLKDSKLQISSDSEQTSELRSVLAPVRMFKEQIVQSELVNYLLLARWYVKRWNETKVIKKIGYNLEKHISNYSISEVIDMMPIEYQQDSVDKVAITGKNVVRQLLHFSMGYFTISTEYRLIAEQLYKQQEERTQSEEYIKANIYHLLAILFLAIHVHCDLLFMKQIISSYEHHFKTALIVEEEKSVNVEELAERLLFQKIVPQRRKSVNSSLLAKIQKIRSKSKSKDSMKKVHTEYQDDELYESKACYKLNETKSKTKTKRSTSKQMEQHKIKKPVKVLNDSLFESTKNLDKRNQRSISTANKVDKPSKQTVKPRSTSKDSQNIKPIKHLPPPPPVKVADKNPAKKVIKKITDEYQLSNAKCPAKKRSQSISSADLSCTGRDLNKTKMSGSQKSSQKSSQKREGENRSRPKRFKSPKQVFSKHYYV